MTYSPRVESAFTTMLEAHGLQRRKAGRGFQVSHALSVAMIVTDYGFDELVLGMVRDVSEPPKPHPWRERKLRYIEQLRVSPRHGARAVAAADKIHNLSKMTRGLLDHGPPYVRPFTAPVEDMIWYHQTVLDTLRTTWDHAILDDQARRLEAFVEAADRIAARD